MPTGWDVFCFISGAIHFNSQQDIRDSILHRCGSEGISMNVKRGLLYSKEDVEASERYVMVCHYRRLENGGIKPYATFRAPEPTVYTAKTITTIHDVIPGIFSDHGEYLNDNPLAGDDGLYRIHPNLTPAFLVTHSAYVILRQAAPSIEPHHLYSIYTACRNLSTIDYGPINGIKGEGCVYWPGLFSSESPPKYADALAFWRGLLFDKSRTDENILQEAWRGAGNLWALVRPDRFPVRETPTEQLTISNLPFNDFATPSHILSLPLEILLLICEQMHPKYIALLTSTCKTMYSRLVPQVDHVVRKYIRTREPWYLPAGPFDFPHGTEEVDWWNNQWRKKGISGEDMDNQIPWLAYRRLCSHSMSMWNRIRIWRVAKQVEQMQEHL